MWTHRGFFIISYESLLSGNGIIIFIRVTIRGIEDRDHFIFHNINKGLGLDYHVNT